MAPSGMMYVGWDVHQEASAVASVAQDYGAAVIALGAIGTRRCDHDQRLRQRHSQAQPLVLGYEAGPSGYRPDHDLTKPGPDGGVVAPTRIVSVTAQRRSLASTPPSGARTRATRARPMGAPHLSAGGRKSSARRQPNGSPARGPGGHRAHRTPPEAGTGAHGAGRNPAPRPSGRGPPGIAGCPVHWGGPARRRTRRPHALDQPPTAEA
jgi:hypothetical protein